MKINTKKVGTMRRNARSKIVSRKIKGGRITETYDRDIDALEAYVETLNGQTRLVMKIPMARYTVDDPHTLNGHEARTLYKLLRKHYLLTGKSTY